MQRYEKFVIRKAKKTKKGFFAARKVDYTREKSNLSHISESTGTHACVAAEEDIDKIAIQFFVVGKN